MATKKKQRKKDDITLSIKGSFEEVMKLSAQPLKDQKSTPKKKAAKKK